MNCLPIQGRQPRARGGRKRRRSSLLREEGRGEGGEAQRSMLVCERKAATLVYPPLFCRIICVSSGVIIQQMYKRAALIKCHGRGGDADKLFMRL